MQAVGGHRTTDRFSGPRQHRECHAQAQGSRVGAHTTQAFGERAGLNDNWHCSRLGLTLSLMQAVREEFPGGKPHLGVDPGVQVDLIVELYAVCIFATAKTP